MEYPAYRFRGRECTQKAACCIDFVEDNAFIPENIFLGYAVHYPSFKDISARLYHIYPLVLCCTKCNAVIMSCDTCIFYDTGFFEVIQGIGCTVAAECLVLVLFIDLMNEINIRVRSEIFSRTHHFTEHIVAVHESCLVGNDDILTSGFFCKNAELVFCIAVFFRYSRIVKIAAHSVGVHHYIYGFINVRAVVIRQYGNVSAKYGYRPESYL